MRAGGLNIAVVFHIVDAGVCHEALVRLPNDLIKKTGYNRQLFPHNEENVSKQLLVQKKREVIFDVSFFSRTSFFL